jgi:hypothetical protein
LYEAGTEFLNIFYIYCMLQRTLYRACQATRQFQTKGTCYLTEITKWTFEHLWDVESRERSFTLSDADCRKK